LLLKKTVQFQKKLAKKKGKFNNQTQDKLRKNQNLKSTFVGNFEVLHYHTFNDLSKLRMDSIPKGETLKEVGSTKVFNKDFNLFDIKNGTPLKTTNKIPYEGTSSDDPILQEYAKNNEGNVFVTDQILSMLLAAPKSIYPWDVVVTYKDGILFIDKRGSESGIDEIHCDETAKEQPILDSENIDSMGNLSVEAKKINDSVREQVLTDKVYSYDNENPFNNEKISSTAFRYRKFKVSNTYTFIVRTEVNGVTLNEDGSIDNTFFIRSLNEFEPKQGEDWSSNLDKQRGKIFINEIKNNSFKICRWATQALLSGTDTLKFGFVMRSNPKSINKHIFVGFTQYSPLNLATQLLMRDDYIWPIATTILNTILDSGEGKYYVVKEPNESKLKIMKHSD